MDDDDLLPPNEPPAPPAPQPAPGRTRNITCEFCKCTLAPSGDYIRLSEEAKALRKLEEKIVDLKDEIERKNAEIAELKTKLSQAQPEPTKRRGFWRTEVGSDG